ncbi:hypothetical protein GCM10009646_43460 [Streptomyces aureus]
MAPGPSPAPQQVPRTAGGLGALARIGGGQRLRLRYGVGNVAGQWQIQLGQKQMHLLHKTLAEQAPGAGGRTGRGPT